MTNYNERLDDLTNFMESINWEFDENGYTYDDNYINFRTANMLRQAIQSLIRNEKLKLLAEVRERAVTLPIHGGTDSYYATKHIQAVSIDVLNKLEAEL